jgi:hypothetical protein
MVPEQHEIILPGSPNLKQYLESDDFNKEIRDPLKAQHEVEIHINQEAKPGTPPHSESLLMTYTRNNAGGLKDAIDYFTSKLVARGLDATTIKGAIPRPKSDSFEESLPYFDSKLLQHAQPPLVTESPTKSTFGIDSGLSFFDKLRKPGSMSSISSFLDRRKNQSSSPGKFFQNGSLNGSRASLASLESVNSTHSSTYRNPWNDSGVNLPEDEHPWPKPTEHKLGLTMSTISNAGDTTPRHELSASLASLHFGTENASRDLNSASSSKGFPGSGSGFGPGPIGRPH